MELITGGAYQGKKEYAKKIFGFTDSQITDGAVCSENDIFSAVCISNYHMFVRRMTESGVNAVSLTRRLCTENPDAVILMNETGCGIVPLEKSERIWREETGRCGCIIAEHSEKVTRLFNSIPVIIKDKS